MAWLLLIGGMVSLVLNIGYVCLKAYEDLRGRRTLSGTIGLLGMIGSNAIFAWTLYMAITNSTDL